MMFAQGGGGAFMLFVEANIGDRIRSGWSAASPSTRESLQGRLGCCGFDLVSEGTNCAPSATLPCGAPLIAAQRPVAIVIATGSFALVAILVSGHTLWRQPLTGTSRSSA